MSKAAVAIILFIATPALADTGYATYYTAGSCRQEGNSGVLTASGERYDESKLTCALPHRYFGKSYKVTSLTTGRSVVVRHSDYGPGRVPRSKGVVVDLTPAAFKALGHPLSAGKIKVEVTNVD